MSGRARPCSVSAAVVSPPLPHPLPQQPRQSDVDDFFVATVAGGGHGETGATYELSAASREYRDARSPFALSLPNG